MTASERLDVLLKHLKISANKLAVEKLGYKDNVKIYHIRHNRNNFSPKIAKDITDAFPEISYSWLLTGEGSMLREGAGGNVSVNHGGSGNVVGVNQGISGVVGGRNLSVSNGHVSNGVGGSDVPPSPASGVPYYDVDFAGGWSSAEVFSEARPSFYIASPDFGGAELACNLVGHSVSRRIPHGAIIGIREVRDWQSYFPTNELYALIMGNGLRTVKVVKRGADGGSLLLLPDPLEAHDRTGYETEEVAASFVSKMFQVVAWARFERLAM